MEISEQIRALLPPLHHYPYIEIDAEFLEYSRVLKSIPLAGKSRTPAEYHWLWAGAPRESHLLAVDKQIYTPDQQTIVTHVGLTEHGVRLGDIAYWNGRIWIYCCIRFPDHSVDHPIEGNSWNASTFLAVFAKEDREQLVALDKKLAWVQVSRAK